jgi:ribonuclease HIII
MLAERNPESPVTAIQDIVKARETKAQKKLATKDTKSLHKQEIESIKNEIKKVAPTKETWMDFVKSIQC